MSSQPEWRMTVVDPVQLTKVLKPLECFQSVRIEWQLSKPSSEYVGKWTIHVVRRANRR